MKACHGAYLTCKAHNGRIVASWLLDCAQRAYHGNFPPENEGRRFGLWLKREVSQGNRSMPADERLLPQMLAMILRMLNNIAICFFPIERNFLQVFQPTFVCTLNILAVLVSSECFVA